MRPKAPLCKGGWQIADFRQFGWGIVVFYNPSVRLTPCHLISAPSAAFGGCAPKRACGRSLYTREEKRCALHLPDKLQFSKQKTACFRTLFLFSYSALGLR